MKMKRFAASVLALLLVLSLCAGARALPEEAEYRSTRRFLELLDDQKVKYVLEGLDGEEDEVVRVTYRLEDENVSFRLCFTPDGEHCAIYAWDLVAFDPADTDRLLREVNGLNRRYHACVFTVDEAEATVTACADVIFRTSGSDEICYEALQGMARVVNAGLGVLLPYEKE